MARARPRNEWFTALQPYTTGGTIISDAQSSSQRVADLYRGNWLKRLVKGPLFNPLINQLVVAIAKNLPGEEWKLRIPVVDKPVVVGTFNGRTFTMLRADKCDIAREIFWRNGGFANRADTLAFETACRLSDGASHFFDIGAYTGLFALGVGVSNPSVRIDAYEIFPENHAILEHNISFNQLSERISANLTGLSDGAGTLRMPRSTNLTRLPSSFSLGWEFAEGEEIPVRPLDELHRGIEGKLVMKIDVEGFEYEVLSGARNALQRASVDIVCEVLKSAPKVEAMNRLLADLGFRIFQFTNDGLVEKQSVQPNDEGRDWLFTKREREALEGLGIPFATIS